MLIRIDDLIVIRSDRYCFMICHDKGMTKFPKGLVAPYYKPFAFVGCFHEIEHIIKRENSETSLEIFKKDQDLEKWLYTIPSKDFTSYKILGRTINFDKDCYTLNFGHFKTYNSSLGSALYGCWTFYLREAEEFQEFFDLSLLDKAYDDFVNAVSGEFNVEFNI